MTKKQFSIGASSNKESKKSKLELFSSSTKKTFEISDVTQEFNKQIVNQFIELFGEKWRYRTIKVTEEICNFKISQLQLKRLSEGKFIHEQTLLALLFVLAVHKKNITLKISKDKTIGII